MDEKTPGTEEPQGTPEAQADASAEVTEGTAEIIASDGTPEVIEAETVTTEQPAAVVEAGATEVVASDGAEVEVAAATAEPAVVETQATTVTVQDAPEAGQPPVAEASTAAATTPAPEAAPAPEAGAAVPPPPPAAGTAVAGAPVPPPAPATTQPSPTGALVCGILAIVFSGLPIVGIILGVVAIVLAGKYFAAGGSAGSGKAGRICGIVGIVLSVVWFIVGIAVSCAAFTMLDDYSTTSSSYSSSSNASAELTVDEEEAAAEAVAMRLQQIKDRDPQMIASITAMAEESFEDEFSYLGIDATMSNCGIDPAEFVELMLKDFDYEFSSFEMASSYSTTKGEASFVCTSMDMWLLSSNLDDIIDEMNAAGGLQGSAAERRQQVGDAIMKALRETGVSHYNFFDVDMENEDGVWVIDEDSWDEEIEYFFTLS